MEAAEAKKVPVPTIRRIPSYLRLLYQFQAEGRRWISATDIADSLELKPIQVRKDMAFTDITGTPKKGYPLGELIDSVRRFLHWEKLNQAVLVGTGVLGKALLSYPAFLDTGLEISAVFDSDPSKIGSDIGGFRVGDVAEAPGYVRENGIPLLILTVPVEAAQEAADRMMEAGIRGIWNFAPVKIYTPPEVFVQQEDLFAGLAVLTERTHQGG